MSATSGIAKPTKAEAPLARSGTHSLTLPSVGNNIGLPPKEEFKRSSLRWKEGGKRDGARERKEEREAEMHLRVINAIASDRIYDHCNSSRY